MVANGGKRSLSPRMAEALNIIIECAAVLLGFSWLRTAVVRWWFVVIILSARDVNFVTTCPRRRFRAYRLHSQPLCAQ